MEEIDVNNNLKMEEDVLHTNIIDEELSSEVKFFSVSTIFLNFF